MNIVETVDDKLKIRNVLASVSDKTGLDVFVPELLEACPDVRFMSTGGTHKAIAKILGERAENHLIAVESYTGFPEMQGGLVKTLHPKIHAGLLGERHNKAHKDYLKLLSEGGIEAVYIDMVVVNLYPFQETVAKEGTTFEQARANIDIGGPAMLRAGAKNFHSCAVVVNPETYGEILHELKTNDGALSLKRRFELAREAFRHTAQYDGTIIAYLDGQNSSKVEDTYKIADAPKGGE